MAGILQVSSAVKGKNMKRIKVRLDDANCFHKSRSSLRRGYRLLRLHLDVIYADAHYHTVNCCATSLITGI